MFACRYNHHFVSGIFFLSFFAFSFFSPSHSAFCLRKRGVGVPTLERALSERKEKREKEDFPSKPKHRWHPFSRRRMRDRSVCVCVCMKSTALTLLLMTKMIRTSRKNRKKLKKQQQLLTFYQGRIVVGGQNQEHVNKLSTYLSPYINENVYL